MTTLLLFIISLSAGDSVYNLKDFRIPDAGAMNLELSGRLYFSGSSGSLRRDYYDSYDSMMRDQIFFHSLAEGNLNWEVNYLGEDRYASLQLKPDVDLNFGYLNSTGFTDTTPFYDTMRVFNNRLSLLSNGTVGFYLGESPFLLGVEGGIDTRMYLPLIPPFSLGFSASGHALFEAGVGRLRNVAPASQAWQFLEEKGISDKEVITNLAELIACRWKYELDHWRYEKFFYDDVENRLKDEGITLSAYDLMRLREIVTSSPSWRLSGNRLRLGLGGYASPSSFSPTVRLLFEGGSPLSRRWQLTYNATGIGTLEEVSEFGGLLQGAGSLVYLVGDSWIIGASADCQYMNNDIMTMPESWSLILNFHPVFISFYLEDKLKIYSGIGYSWFKRDLLYEEESNHGLQFNTGLTWRLR